MFYPKKVLNYTLFHVIEFVFGFPFKEIYSIRFKCVYSIENCFQIL